jgi:hypothetical protein
MSEPAFKQAIKRKSTSTPAQTNNMIGEAPTSSSSLRTSYESTLQKIEDMFNDGVFPSVEDDRVDDIHMDMKGIAEKAYDSGNSNMSPTHVHAPPFPACTPARTSGRLPA